MQSTRDLTYHDQRAHAAAVNNTTSNPRSAMSILLGRSVKSATLYRIDAANGVDTPVLLHHKRKIKSFTKHVKTIKHHLGITSKPPKNELDPKSWRMDNFQSSVQLHRSPH